jgi:PPOX class probable F420-dependent enzyme
VSVVGWDAAEPYCRAPHVVFVATTSADGSPHVVPIWADTDDGVIRINTTEGTVKLRNLRRDPRVALAIQVSSGPYLAFAIRGRVIDEVTGPEAADHIDALSRAYDGVPWPFADGEREIRVILRIRPEHVVTMS